MCFTLKEEKGHKMIINVFKGGSLLLLQRSIVCGVGLGIGDVRKCTDEEHSIWSGGSKIRDLAKCGWEEKRWKMIKTEKERKYEGNEK